MSWPKQRKEEFIWAHSSSQGEATSWGEAWSIWSRCAYNQVEQNSECVGWFTFSLLCVLDLSPGNGAIHSWMCLPTPTSLVKIKIIPYRHATGLFPDLVSLTIKIKPPQLVLFSDQTNENEIKSHLHIWSRSSLLEDKKATLERSLGMVFPCVFVVRSGVVYLKGNCGRTWKVSKCGGYGSGFKVSRYSCRALV